MASTSNPDHATNKLFDNIERLKANGSNWDVWKTQVTLVLRAWRLLLYADGSKPKPLPVPAPTGDKAAAGPDPANTAEIEEWDWGNLEAHIPICMTLDYETTSLVNGKEFAAEIWATLKSHF